MTDIMFRSFPAWPYPSTRDRRGFRTFSATWTSTLRLLQREIATIDGTEPLIGLVAQGDVTRRDGQLRADIRPSHPGVEVSFNTRINKVNTRLVYATDVCDFWQHNVRSIALGLEALRAVGRYGIAERGQQYAGFAALSAGGPDPAKGERLVREVGGSIRDALFKHHPDHGGNPRDFADVQAFREKVGA